MQIVILAAILVGIVLIVLSLIFFKRQSAANGGFGYADNTIQALDSSLAEMDKSVEEFNQLSATVFDEIDKRYQELLFLYSLIDDKKTAIDKIYENPPPQAIRYERTEAETPRSKAAEAATSHFQSHPKRDEIVHLRKQGIPVAEIARQLDMGQGEVKLIIELEKAR